MLCNGLQLVDSHAIMSSSFTAPLFISQANSRATANTFEQLASGGIEVACPDRANYHFQWVGLAVGWVWNCGCFIGWLNILLMKDIVCRTCTHTCSIYFWVIMSLLTTKKFHKIAHLMQKKLPNHTYCVAFRISAVGRAHSAVIHHRQPDKSASVSLSGWHLSWHHQFITNK